MVTPRANPKEGPTVQRDGTSHINGNMQPTMQINCVELVRVRFYARKVLYWNLVTAQLSKKSANHPNCAFADSASTVMSGAMISLTPCIAPTNKATIDRQVAREYAEFKDADDMIQQLNSILSLPHGFPQIPPLRKDSHTMTFEPKKRHHQYVMCPEEDCESLVYFSDQNHSMIETLGLHQHPFWEERVKAFYKWFNKSASKTSRDAWTWEEGKDTFQVANHSRRFQEESVSPSKSSRPAQSRGEGSSMARHW